MFTDCHCHILPGIDDGPQSISDSVKMLEMEASQNVSDIIFTPHYYCSKEDIEEFLRKRNEAYKLLMKYVPEKLSLTYRLGAEVYLAPKITNIDNFEKLCISESDIMLIELPYDELKPWVMAEINKIIYDYRITPIFAHINRYFNILSKKDLKQLLALQNILFQVNNSCFINKNELKIYKKFFYNKIQICLGSDCHNIDNRKPNFNYLLRENIEIKQKDIFCL